MKITALELKAIRKRKQAGMNEKRTTELLESIFKEDVHVRRIFSLSQAVVGVLHATSLGIHAIGAGLAAAQNLDPKHTVKQVDRLLSNVGISVWDIFESWVPFMVGQRKDIVVALDWTEFDADDQSTIVLSLVTSHGRATPLIWNTVVKSELKNNRNKYEDDLLVRFREVLPPDTEVLLLADRGFGDQKLFDFLKELQFHYVIRFRGNIYVTAKDGERRKAVDWMNKDGRSIALRKATITADDCPVETVICVHDKKMKEPWCMASDLRISATMAIKRYARRFTIEESFRDLKDSRYGLGLSSTRIGRPDRRDKLILIATLAVYLVTLLGAAGEALGMDRRLKTNTSKRRTLSLFRQGLFWYSAIPNMSDDRLEPLMIKFNELLRNQPLIIEIFGII